MKETARRILEVFDRLGLSRLSVADFRAALPAPDAELGPDTEISLETAIQELLSAGALREIAGGFELTEFGSLQAANPLMLTLLGRRGCHLCHEVLVWLEPLAAGLGVTLRQVDVDTDRVLRERYGNDIPVLFLGSDELSRHHFQPRAIEKAVKAARKARRRE